MENPPMVTQDYRDWCANISVFVVSAVFCIIGFIVMIYNEVLTGIVLFFIGVTALTLTVCATLGKLRSIDKQPEDRPPSYRRSWRLSFMRRVGQSNNQRETEETLPPDTVPVVMLNSNTDLLDNENELRFSASNFQLGVRGASRFGPDLRQTHSLVNLRDPPSYDDVLMAMDETTKQKLKSDLCLPSLTRF